MSKLKNKIIVVTGGNGLLGSALMRHLRGEGAIVINGEINVESDLENGIVNCDITNEISIQQVIDIILQKHSRIDGWVNNAYPHTADWGNKFENVLLSSWQKNIDCQLNSIFSCCRLVLEVMKAQKGGSIVNMSSIYGVVGPDFAIYNGTDMTMPAAYSAIKGGIINFTRYLASYFGSYGIRVNCVSPGGIFSDQDNMFVKNYSNKVPLKRMGIPEDIAPSVSFLLSDDAAYITGHNLIVDGGWTCI